MNVHFAGWAGTRRARGLLIAAVALTFFGATGGTVSAGTQSEAQCAFAADIVLSPGLSLQSSSGTMTTGGPTATEDCTGPVNGHDINGSAVFSGDYRYGTRHPDSCAAGLMGDGEGTGIEYRTYPTTGGEQRVTDRMTFHYGQPSTRGGVISGTFEGEHCSGTFELTPTEGDCVTRPITKAHVTGHEVFRT
jgi:hypothetical protein